MEEVTEKVRKQAGYIAYENEPQYPKLDGVVSESYFGNNSTNFTAQYEHIRNFYRNYEKSAIRNIELNRQRILEDNEAAPEAYGKMKYFEDKLPEIREKLNIAQGCLDVYEKGALYRLDRGKMIRSIIKTEDDILNARRQLDNDKHKLQIQNCEYNEVTSRIKLLKEKLAHVVEIDIINEKLNN